MTTDSDNTLVLRAIRLAEYAHRNRSQGPHFRKAPKGQDRPYYFVHLAEVAWMLGDAGCSHEVIAAGYLHDLVEDCGYSVRQLSDEIGNSYVAELVDWVSEPGSVDKNGKKLSWEIRNRSYLERIRTAPIDALNLSCADKTSNLLEMCHWLNKGYQVADFTSRDHYTQLNKFLALDRVFQNRVTQKIYLRFQKALQVFRNFNG